MTVEQIVAALRAERQDRNWSTRYVAERSGLSISQISYYENGHREPTLYSLVRWAAGLGLVVALRREESADATS